MLLLRWKVVFQIRQLYVFLLSQQKMTSKKNFIGVFPSKFVNCFISLHDMISESGAKYLFVVMVTD